MTMLEEEKKDQQKADEEEKAAEGAQDPSEDDDEDVDLDDEDLEDEEDPEDKEGEEEEGSRDGEKDKLEQLNAQRKHWRDRAKKAEEALKKSTQQPSEPKPKKKESVGQKEEALAQERTDFRFDHPELTTQIVKEIETFALARGVSLEEAAKSPVIRILIKREQKRKELAAASPSSRNQPAMKRAGKSWDNASREEIEKEAARIKMGGRQ